MSISEQIQMPTLSSRLLQRAREHANVDDRLATIFAGACMDPKAHGRTSVLGLVWSRAAREGIPRREYAAFCDQMTIAFQEVTRRRS